MTCPFGQVPTRDKKSCRMPLMCPFGFVPNMMETGCMKTFVPMKPKGPEILQRTKPLCAEYSILVDGIFCKPCPIGQWPNLSKTMCEVNDTGRPAIPNRRPAPCGLNEVMISGMCSPCMLGMKPNGDFSECIISPINFGLPKQLAQVQQFGMSATPEGLL